MPFLIRQSLCGMIKIFETTACREMRQLCAALWSSATHFYRCNRRLSWMHKAQSKVRHEVVKCFRGGANTIDNMSQLISVNITVDSILQQSNLRAVFKGDRKIIKSISLLLKSSEAQEQTVTLMDLWYWSICIKQWFDFHASAFFENLPELLVILVCFCLWQLEFGPLLLLCSRRHLWTAHCRSLQLTFLSWNILLNGRSQTW